jgi:hypothetical protein
MNFYEPPRWSGLRAIGRIAANKLHFWISLVGFVCSILGFLQTREALYGFGYGFFGVILGSCLFVSIAQYRRDGTRRIQRRDQDFD